MAIEILRIYLKGKIHIKYYVIKNRILLKNQRIMDSNADLLH